MKQRKGFTLIELMIVIAIIIILAAIAIPNYLAMTARAKKSRVASDFAALATALETYRTDWGIYPIDTAAHTLTNAPGNIGYFELTGTTGATKNISGATTAAGDAGPVVYMTTNILDSMKNPYNSGLPYQYISNASGTHWRLSASEISTGTEDTLPWWYRTDLNTTLTEVTTGSLPTP